VSRAVQAEIAHDLDVPTPPIYLDHHATTPVDPRVVETMQPLWDATFGNPASVHGYGRAARERVDSARADVAHLLDARASEIVFTSGATEANNLAILGVARASRARGRHVVTQRTEHRSVLDPCRRLEEEGFEVTYLDVDASGRVSPNDVEAAIRKDTVLVSIMRCNNEVGTIQDLGSIARATQARVVRR
jgi:cysteine desulfurase